MSSLLFFLYRRQLPGLMRNIYIVSYTVFLLVVTFAFDCSSSTLVYIALDLFFALWSSDAWLGLLMSWIYMVVVVSAVHLELVSRMPLRWACGIACFYVANAFLRGICKR